MRYNKYSGSGNFFSLPNEVFLLGLCAGELAVYSFLKRCENRKTHLCWPSIKSIVQHCNCSENAARDAVKQLVDRGFIRKVKTSRCARNGKWLQGNNHYYILPLPALSTAGHRASRKSTTGDVVEEVYQQNKG